MAGLIAVVLHWLNGKGDYQQFVSKGINKINAKAYITWRHVPSNQNPADIGSRGVYGNYGGQDQHGCNNRNNGLHNQTSC